MDGDSSTQQQNLLQLCHVSLKANENEPELLCSICDEPVDSLGHFEQHLESINQHIKSKRLSKRFKNCKTCGLRCATSVQLMKHMQLHHKQLYNEKKQPSKPYLKCPMCPYSTFKQAYLDSHVSRHKEGKVNEWGDTTYEYNCKHCPFRTDEQSYYNRHLKLHKKGRISKNGYIRKPRFVDPDEENEDDGEEPKEVENERKKWEDSVMNTYQEQLQPEAALKCFKCDFECTNTHEMRAHMTKHYSGRPIKCEDCERSYPAIGLFYEHLKHYHRRETDTLFLCEKCTYKTGSMFYMRKHVKHHVPIENYLTCEFCGGRHPSKDRLRLHIRRVHMGQKVMYKPSRCNLCDRTLSSPSNLKLHKMVHHGMEKPHKCDKCPKSYISAVQLRSHLERHQKLAQAGNPKRLHKLPRERCAVCNNEYNILYLQTHIKRCGKDIKFHRCPECKKGFPTLEELRKHESAVTLMHRCSHCEFMTCSIFRYRRHIFSEHAIEQFAKAGKDVDK